MTRNLKSIGMVFIVLLACAEMAHARKGIAPEELNNMLTAKNKIVIKGDGSN